MMKTKKYNVKFKDGTQDVFNAMANTMDNIGNVMLVNVVNSVVTPDNETGKAMDLVAIIAHGSYNSISVLDDKIIN